MGQGARVLVFLLQVRGRNSAHVGQGTQEPLLAGPGQGGGEWSSGRSDRRREREGQRG